VATNAPPAPFPQAALPPTTAAPSTQPPASLPNSETPILTFLDEVNACGQEGTCWLGVDYLMWWIRGSRIPPLLTTNPTGTPLAQAGLIGTGGTTVRFGDRTFDNDFRNGVRGRAGIWLDDERRCGLEARFFILEGQAEARTVGTSTGDAIAGRPFINAITGQPATQLVAFPGVLAGDATARVGSSNLWGGDVVLRKAICCTACNPCQDICFRFDLIAGYRFLGFDDDVSIREDLRPLGGLFVPGTQIVVQDSFCARNRFHGGVLGVDGEWYRGPWLVGVRPRLSVGYSSQEVTINGSTTASAPGAATVTRSGGLLAQPSNIGRYRFGDWTVVPEIECMLGYQVMEGVRFLVGYSFLFWPRVARAGEQIDVAVNPNFLPPFLGANQDPMRPAVLSKMTDLWVQGISLGLELRY
jgi:hypothetical protein